MHRRQRHHRHLIESLEPRQFLSTVTVANATASESADSLTFHVSLDAPATHDVTLNYVTTPVSATPNKDYVPARGHLTLPAGQTEGDIAVTLKDDSFYEAPETLRLNLSATGAKLAKTSAKGTIADDDPSPAVSIKDVTTKEGNAGLHLVTLTVSLAKPAGALLSFDYATSDDTPHYLAATAGSDYTAAKGTLTFLPGQIKKTIQVAVKGDKAVESDEAFLVTLTYHEVVGVTAATATVTIRNDDHAAKSDAPVLNLADATVAENDTASPALTVTLSRPAAKPVTFHYATTLHKANSPNGLIVAPQLSDLPAGANFTPAQGTLTIPAGQTSATIPLSLTNDSLREPTYSIDVTLSAAKGAALPNDRPSASARVTVTDDDPLYSLVTIGPSLAFSNSQLLAASSFANSYPTTLTAVGTITGGTLNTSQTVFTGSGGTYVNGGSVTINTPITVTGVQGVPLTYVPSGFMKTGSGTLTLVGGVTGSTALTSNSTLILNNPTLIGGSTSLTLATPLNLSLLSGTLLLSPDTTFTFPATTSPDTVRARLISAFNAGTWTGPGISSSAASNDPTRRTAVAYAVQPDGSTLVKPALYGDINLDGTVDDADRALVQQSLSDPSASPSWSAGDFNYDNQINADDLALLDRNMGRSL